MLGKQKEGMCGETPYGRVTKALYTLNHLTVLTSSQNPVILHHVLSLQSYSDVQSPKHKVFVKDILANKWEGLLGPCYLGRRYTCMSMDVGIQWVPAQRVCPALCFAWDHIQRRFPDIPAADIVEQ